MIDIHHLVSPQFMAVSTPDLDIPRIQLHAGVAALGQDVREVDGTGLMDGRITHLTPMWAGVPDLLEHSSLSAALALFGRALLGGEGRGPHHLARLQ